MEASEFKYLKGLSKVYPNIAKASNEIINLQAILNLPKGTEHFVTDIHGEYEQFHHVLRNGSGAVRRKIDDVFGATITTNEKKALATLIYYPEEKIKIVEAEEADNIDDWYRVTIYRLIQVTKIASAKYTRSKVRKAMSKEFAYIIEELVSERYTQDNKEEFYNGIIDTAIETGMAKQLIIAFCNLIQRLTVDHLHVLGDIYDRGPYPNKIMELLMSHHSVDIQWGNHDIVWMGAAAGQTANIATLLRISAKYGNLPILEESYGINLLPLARFAMKVYADDPCSCFTVGYREDDITNIKDVELDKKMHKAIAIIQFKIEGQIINRRPDFHMEKRNLLDKINLEKKTVTVEGKEYELLDTNFPTIDPKDPYKLSKEEADVMERLKQAFINCEKLQRDVRFLFSKGSLYKVFNDNLLFHGCIPLDKNGKFKKVKLFGKTLSGKELFDTLDNYARLGYYSLDPEEKLKGLDMMWYMWINENSPLFGKDKMTTFERYFIADKATHKEPKNPYYKYINEDETVDMILNEFGLFAEDSHIINGHIPVAFKDGESPVKCHGRVLAIDGGFSKAYQPKTGIAGYTLIYNSFGLRLAAHEPFKSMEQAIINESDIHSDNVLVQRVVKRKRVADTDTGKELKDSIEDLKKLVKAYRQGCISQAE
ncbi:fructose-1,6-bisphosphatase-3 [Acetitomaculum ruminis DSM 5522]|uniref:Fructose-1,6-bisphosphatase class 3 n=1 Tax=Acetitomaculum ruminis DSM 5522 TaxID=1120918 RepID=A0A1I0Z8U0_9FIRM|nr:fructose-1,6-bisphosphatase [Acetitomaculum ruminis]SFB20990.1 fructose-1,6-bisphosphatase-3 [Acetitomaculum ruminis DSM 5522]